jgi:coenzyme Q-binding protein COQ10
MAGATRSIVINAPPDKVFDIITDYEKYPQFVSEVKKVTTSERQGNSVKLNYEISLVKTLRYTIRVTEERPRKMSWTFVEGDVMKTNTGSWVLEPEGEGKTRATYTVEVTVGPLVPKAIINGLVDQSLPKMMDAFKRRAEGA